MSASLTPSIEESAAQPSSPRENAAQPPSPPLLLSVEEAAAQWRIGRSRMFTLIRRGDVLSVMVGGSRRVPYDSVKAYVSRLVSEQASDSGTGIPAA